MPRKHVVQPGECLATIAATYGVNKASQIHDHQDNAELRKQRPNGYVLLAGDEVVVPDLPRKTETLETGRRHVIVVNRPKVTLNVTVRDREEKPLAGKAFRFEAHEETFEGTTTGEGKVECEIPVTITEGQLVVWAEGQEGRRYNWDLRLGYLDPIVVPSGVRQRLNNLGYFAETNDEQTVDEGLRCALRAFQEHMGLKVTGEPDEPTKAKLVEVHGGV